MSSSAQVPPPKPPTAREKSMGRRRRLREAERLAACDDAIALLREIANLETDDDGDVMLGADETGHNDLMSRIAAFLAINDQ